MDMTDYMDYELHDGQDVLTGYSCIVEIVVLNVVFRKDTFYFFCYFFDMMIH